MGFQVRSCESFGGAIGYLRRDKFALAVIDLSLQGPITGAWDRDASDPNLDGYKLLAAAHNDTIPTIVVSGIIEPEEFNEFIRNIRFPHTSRSRHSTAPVSPPGRRDPVDTSIFQ